MSNAVNRSNLGAWLLKCNPEVWDFPRFVEDGGEDITDWSLADNSRSKMMAPGDLVIFWVSGHDKKYERGIWGIGHVTGYAEDSMSFDEDGPGWDSEVGYWLDDQARKAVQYGISVNIPLLLDAPITATRLLFAGIDDLEVQKMPQGSNPSWVSREQLAKIQDLQVEWPEPPDEEVEITVTDQGAAFGDPLQNRFVEQAAMDAVTEVYTNEGWSVDDVSKQNVGWDLTCTRSDGVIAKLEVKGLSGSHRCVLLTANEIRAAKASDEWVLAVVTRALTAPELSEFDRDATVEAAKPYVFRADLEMSGQQ